jgi:putative nucleotidyltransferase with HDIG domain
VTALFLEHWGDLLATIDGDVHERLVASAPSIGVGIDLNDTDAIATVFADFVDLKSPFTAGHSRMVSVLAEDAATELGLPEVDRKRLRIAGLLHDLGRVSVSNAIWDKKEPLTEDERRTLRGHAAFTERILEMARPWKDLALLAASDHERADGSGYPRKSPAPNLGLPARILAAADVLAALVGHRPHRAAHSIDDSARILREEAARGRLDRACTEAVLASQGLRAARSSEKPSLPKGITERELEVLRLLARGLVDKEIAASLGISHRTVHHHNASLFQKIGVTTRGAAVLFAIENGLT